MPRLNNWRSPKEFIISTAFLVSASLIGGCASISEGTKQTVTIITDPSGATCNISQGGNLIAIVNPTPGSTTVPKSKYDLIINCKRDGYGSGVGVLRSETDGATAGNLLLGGVVGLAVDASTGAINRYPNIASIILAETNQQISPSLQNEQRKLAETPKPDLADVQNDVHEFKEGGSIDSTFGRNEHSSM